MTTRNQQHGWSGSQEARGKDEGVQTQSDVEDQKLVRAQPASCLLKETSRGAK